MSKITILYLSFLLFGALIACNSQNKTEAPKEELVIFEKLSDYNFFSGNIADLIPAKGVHRYELNTPLFSDYAEKARFISLPPGKNINLEEENIEFPQGTVLIKNFFYHKDKRNPEAGRQLIETRLLLKTAEDWEVANYEWNPEQTEAVRNILGAKKDISWSDEKGLARAVAYTIPDNNDCKGCHVKKGVLQPIGPKARNLNKQVLYETGLQNQLTHFQEEGILTGLVDVQQLPQLPDWHAVADFSLAERARAYLDVNCAHCHNAEGPANNTGLFLEYEQEEAFRLGVKKGPVSAAQGSGDLRYNIVPGNADASIMVYRMNSAETGIAMPELGRSLVHTEGVELIRDWINSM